VAGRLKPRCAVNKKITSPTKCFRGIWRGKSRPTPVFSSNRAIFGAGIGVGIDGGIQPISLVIKLNHGFIDFDMIRVSTVYGL